MDLTQPDPVVTKQLEATADFLWALINLHLQEEHLTDTHVILILRNGSIEDSTANLVLRYGGVPRDALRTTARIASEIMGSLVPERPT